jgi:hypothetical protein
MRNSREVGEGEAFVENFSAELGTDIVRKRPPLSNCGNGAPELYHFSKHIILLDGPLLPIVHGAWVSHQFQIVNPKN